MNRVEGLGEEKMGFSRLHGRGQGQTGEAAGFRFFHDGRPGSRFQPQVGPQLAVEQIEMIEGEPTKPAVGVLDDRRRPFLADAQHDLDVFGEPGPLRRGQQIGVGFTGGDGSREYQPETQQHKRAEVFHQST